MALQAVAAQGAWVEEQETVEIQVQRAPLAPLETSGSNNNICASYRLDVGRSKPSTFSHLAVARAGAKSLGVRGKTPGHFSLTRQHRIIGHLYPPANK